ncbi:unnamed protein product [Eruca vesicaria subsp. sativa]|uniref:Agamous-like MADS-box protein AGL18 n=1 Tax=Eruca vesicaria subsp. sativa TaxID=29727 RepID=A0ABC8LPG6_ERUVS|nr:unnamed protein product [Eruca vesicaria subsp. sativa]
MKKIDLKKKKTTERVLCDFCGSSSNRYEHTQEEDQDETQLLIESELKRLRLLTRRMTGKDLHGLTFAELLLLETLLNQVLLPVKKLKKKTELEEEESLPNQVTLQCQTQIEYERRSSESIENEFERLWLLKERMNGRELAGMTSSELRLLEGEINCGLQGLHDQMFGPRMDQIASQQKEKLITQLRDVEERLGTR